MSDQKQPKTLIGKVIESAGAPLVAWGRHLFGPDDEPDDPDGVVLQGLRIRRDPDTGLLYGIVEPKEKDR